MGTGLQNFTSFWNTTNVRVLTPADQIHNEICAQDYSLSWFLRGKKNTEVIQNGSKIKDFVLLEDQATAVEFKFAHLPCSLVEMGLLEIQTASASNSPLVISVGRKAGIPLRPCRVTLLIMSVSSFLPRMIGPTFLPWQYPQTLAYTTSGVRSG